MKITTAAEYDQALSEMDKLITEGQGDAERYKELEAAVEAYEESKEEGPAPESPLDHEEGE